MADLLAEERLLEAAAVRLLATEAERRRHDQLLGQHHFLRNASAVGQVLRHVAKYHGEWVTVLTFCSSAWHLKSINRWLD
jgi:hypothetical protein